MVRKLSLLVPTPMSVDQFFIKFSEYAKLPRLFEVFLMGATQFGLFFGFEIFKINCCSDVFGSSEESNILSLCPGKISSFPLMKLSQAGLKQIKQS